MLNNKLKIVTENMKGSSAQVYMNGEMVQGLYSIEINMSVDEAVRVKMEMLMSKTDIEINGIDYETVLLICKEEEWYETTRFQDKERHFVSNKGRTKTEPFECEYVNKDVD